MEIIVVIIGVDLFLFDNFIEFDRYLYLENNVPKDTQITIIQNTNYNDLLELLDEREFSHLYLYFFPLEEIDIDVFEIIDLLPDDFIVNKLNLLTFNELKLLLRGEAKIYNISIENRHKLLSIFKKEGKINLIKIAMRIDLKKNKSYAETVRNIFIVLYFMYNMEIKGVLNMLILNDDNKKKFNEYLEKLDKEILFSIYLKVKNHDLNGQIYQRQNSA